MRAGKNNKKNGNGDKEFWFFCPHPPSSVNNKDGQNRIENEINLIKVGQGQETGKHYEKKQEPPAPLQQIKPIKTIEEKNNGDEWELVEI